MPTIDDYASLAPFTLDELVAAANSILRDRPSLRVQNRTVRFYISGGLLPPPSGGPKFARYSLEHLESLLAIRRGLDAGLSLEQAAGKPKSEAARVRPPQRYNSKDLTSDGTSPMPGNAVRRIRLTPASVLEVEDGRDLRRELRAAARALFELAESAE